MNAAGWFACGMTRMFSILLLPGMRLVERLSMRGKFLLLGLVLIVPFSLVIVSERGDYRTIVRQLEHERDGVAQLRPARDGLAAMATHRGLAQMVLAGDSSASAELDRVAREVEAAFERLEAVAPDSAERADWRRAWQAFRPQATMLASRESFERHSRLIRAGMDWVAGVAERSGLKLDTEHDTHYLAELVTQHLPVLAETAGLLRGRSASALAGGALSREDYVVLHMAKGEHRGALLAARKAIERTRRLGLDDEFARIEAMAEIFQASIAEQVLGDAGPRGSARDIFDQGSRIIEACDALYRHSLDVLDARLSERVAEQERKGRLHLAWFVFALIFASYLALATLRAMVDAIHAIVSSSDRLARADFSASVAVASRDELSLLSRQIDSMRLQLGKTFEAEREREVQRNAAIIDATMDGFFVADMNGRMMDCNDVYSVMLGYSRDELLELHVSEIEAMESPEEIARHIGRVIDLGRDRFDTRHRRKDGSLVDVEINVTLAATSEPRQLFAFVHDISVRKRGEADLIEACNAAERANAAKSEFLSRMSHELRTPLNAIIGFAQMLALPGKSSLTEQQADNVQEILKAGQHLLIQVNEVLDLARIESGRIELSLEPLPLAPLVKDCIAQVQPLTSARGIAIAAPLEETLALQGDYTRVKQVLLNLLSNAIKYNRDGGQIHVAAVASGEHLRIEVRDTGRGIAPEKRDRLFKPFERLESSYDGIEGIGIGLALVKRLVEAMGGEIGLESEVGVGSTFWFALPVARLPVLSEPKVGAGGTASVAPGVLASAQAPRRVLYIEDNPVNLKLIRKIVGLRPEFALLHAMNAESGLEIARRERPALILLDIDLSGMDGLAVVAQLQAWPETATIPVVAVSANAMARDIERGKAAGFADYLTKPIDIARLYLILDALPAEDES